MLSKYHQCLRICSVFVLAWIASDSAESCIPVRPYARDAFRHSEAIYLAKFDADSKFQVLSKWKGPDFVTLEIPFILDEAMLIFDCSPQEELTIGSEYIVSAGCLPRVLESGVAFFDCHGEAFLSADHKDYIEYLEQPCVVTREGLTNLLAAWKRKKIETVDVVTEFTRMKIVCDADDWYKAPDRYEASLTIEVLEALASVFHRVDECGEVAKPISERIRAELIEPTVFLLGSGIDDPESDTVYEITDRWEVFHEQVLDLECDQ